MKGNNFILQFIFLFFFYSGMLHGQENSIAPNVIVSTDIGGDDPDDYQSLIHFLLYADRFSISGLVSSPPGKGRVDNILEVLMAYDQDYKFLRAYNKQFPHPDSLRKITKQGAVDTQPNDIPEKLSSGASWMIEKALDLFPQPLYILVWGSLTDVAQAVHHNPIIKKNIRVYSIGSWNTKQDPKARDYLYFHHRDLWWVENNTSFRGMYIGGFQEGNFSNRTFVEKCVRNFGAMGKLFWVQKKDIKMGDTPSVLYLLSGHPGNPLLPSWGGSFYQPFKDRSYWTDLPDEKYRENNFDGAITVNRYRELYLNDWAERMAFLPYMGNRQ